jgi:branched-subunit amino acid aminotransferase/4-amino-4-deoxychorismate lyase
LLTVTDRGFQVGDGAFETIRVVATLPGACASPEHSAAAAAVAIDLPGELIARLDRAVAEVCGSDWTARIASRLAPEDLLVACVREKVVNL